MDVYEGETNLALRKIGFDTGGLPFELESRSKPFSFWQAEPSNDEHEEMWQAIESLSKKDAVTKLKTEFGKGRYAYQLFERLNQKFGQS